MQQIETYLSREKEQFLKYESKEKDLLGQLSDIEKDILDKRVELKKIREKIKASEGDLKTHKEGLSRLEESILRLEDLINERIVAFYKYARRGYLRILANSRDLDQLNHMMKYLKIILDRDRTVLEQMAEEQKEYKNEVSVIQKKIDTIRGLKEAEDNKLSSLKKDMDKKVILLAKIHQEKEFYGTAVKELQSAARNLRDTILNLDRDLPEKNSLPTGFAESKGSLPLPLPGKIVKETKKRGERGFDNYKGIYIHGDSGTEVRAVFHGRVDFSGQLKGYGQVIIINHGSRYFTISAYLLQREKSEGDMVARGEVIGRAGETGLVAGPALYFEIRKGETNLDPLKWLKVN